VGSSPKSDAALLAVRPDISRPDALAQLTRVLDSPQFRSSKRCSHLLRYVVEHALDNHFESLKERTIGVEVFERDPHYDTSQDPVVRIAAGDVRKRLAQYYLETGHEEETRISLPLGTYVPEIQPPPDRSAETPKLTPLPVPPIARGRTRWIGAAVLGSVVLAATAAAIFRPESPLDRFWAPVLEAPGSVMVCMGQPRTFVFQAKSQAALEQWFEKGTNPQEPPAELQPNLPLRELVPAWDRYISLGDTQTLARFSTMFGAKGKPMELRGGRSVTLAELRGKPAVLIGAFNNQWSLGLAGELRYYFEHDRANAAQVVRDRNAPDKSEWKVVKSWPHLDIDRDYGLITRVRNPTTEQTVVIVAGITQYGTHAAGEFLSNPTYFEQILKQAPADWHRKNLQVVFSTKVMSGTTGPPVVLAVHSW
jgi:hypothetical protein